MSYKVDNAIILAAGKSNRFAPLSHEMPKALIEVRGEVLIERQIKQLKDAGIDDIIIVTGYMSEQFDYLADKFGVTLVKNNEYKIRNNNSSINAVKDYLGSSYVCSSDNYLSINPFETIVEDSYYSTLFSYGPTNEWCVTEDASGYIDSVNIGGENSWYMLGHTFWNEDFTKRFLEILADIYDEPETAGMLWEKIYMRNLDTLKMKLRKYNDGDILEFDTLDELRLFDRTYISDTRSEILKRIATQLDCDESEIVNIKPLVDENDNAIGITYTYQEREYEYLY
ncbi:MAG: NTP transferase domain-containing protein [Firmicutes bacterium]|nr:NTP transferase domain-containing protein [Bacillota bacterium]